MQLDYYKKLPQTDYWKQNCMIHRYGKAGMIFVKWEPVSRFDGFILWHCIAKEL